MIRKYKRIIAVFLLLNFLTSIVVPNISWALTAGPTAPEATSFEPVDTTDMVNLATGDLVYNIPLLEVPGPSGGYPLSLSYHAGIQPNEEASWVGLGWTLNPGAINRNVNGFADDFNNIEGSQRTYWHGGATETFTLGVNAGYGGLAGPSAGLVISQDTYKGFGVGYNATVRVGGKFGKAKVGMELSGGVSPYGDSYASAGASVGIGGAQAQVSIGPSGAANASVGYTKGIVTGSVSYSQSGFSAQLSANGASIATSQNGGVSIAVGGAKASFYNSKSGNVRTSESGFQADIPTPWGFEISLGYSYQRYWIDETVNIGAYGSLYFPDNITSSSDLHDKTFDVYDLANGMSLFGTPADQFLSGSFIDYDAYNVVSQGLAGSIRPFHFKSYLIRQTKLDMDDDVLLRSYPLGDNPNAAFRFVGDFSNRFKHNSTNDKFTQSNLNTTNPFFQYDPNQQTGTGEPNDLGYLEDDNILAGSRAVDWFTNEQIKDKGTSGNPSGEDAAIRKGFIDCIAKGFNRTTDDKIGGFKITNSSGVSYHYALPAYSYDEYTYSGKVDEENVHHFNLNSNPEKYAYTWLLTAVTGPDYIDVDEDGYLSEGDMGYWVRFDYGKWVGDYCWRNPEIGFNKDIDRDFSNYSKGKKELYYLNTVTTPTHTAIFVKQIRYDGKGVVPEFEGAINPLSADSMNDVDDGGFTKRSKGSNPAYMDFPASVLKLKSIYLVENRDSLHNEIPDAGVYVDGTLVANKGKHIFGGNVIDIYDIQQESFFTELSNKAIRRIDFNTDYSLCNGTINSFISDVDAECESEFIPETTDIGVTRYGKLTLNSISFVGKNNVSLVPDLKFKYDLDEHPILATVNPRPGGPFSVMHFECVASNHGLVEGDILKFTLGDEEIYGFVLRIENNSTFIVNALSTGDWDTNPLNSSYSEVKLKLTKNPIYSKEFYDLWGMYKVDFGDYGNIPEDILRMVTSTSSRALDVWSLRSIATSVGSIISVIYEPDEYQDALKSLSNVPIKRVETLPNGNTKFILYEDVDLFGLKNGDQVQFRMLSAMRFDVWADQHFYCNDVPKDYVYTWSADDYSGSTLPIQNINGASFELNYRLIDRMMSGTCIMKTTYHWTDTQSGGCIRREWMNASTPIFLGGEILFDKGWNSKGGGLRVKRLSIDDGKTIRSTKYEYINGVTPYEPLGFAIPIKKLGIAYYSCLKAMEQEAIDEYRQWFFSNVYQKFFDLFANSRELPGPGVMYELVKVSEEIEQDGEIIEIPGHSEYLFEVFSPNSIDIHSNGLSFLGVFGRPFASTNIPLGSNYSGSIMGLPVTKISLNNVARLEDYSAIMGSLKRITLFDKDGKKINETINRYLHDNFDKDQFKSELTTKYKDQGVIEETFADSRIIKNPTEQNQYSLYGLVSQKLKYPSIQTGQVVINYKTGITTESKNLEFDFYSGEVTKTLSRDGLGNYFVSQVVPAYKNYDGMGLAMLGGRNMLTQQGLTMSYKCDSNGMDNLGVLVASAQTWSDQIPVLNNYYGGTWRKQSNYTWVGNDNLELPDGLYPYSDFEEFNFDNLSNNSEQWQKTVEISLYDGFSHELEAIDFNGNYSATKMSLDGSRVLVTSANSKYKEFTFSSAEEFDGYYYEGNVTSDGSLVNTSTYTPHTGESSIYTQNASVAAFRHQFFHENKKYLISVWSSNPQATLKYKFTGPTDLPVQSTELTSKGKAGNWYLLSATIDLEEEFNNFPVKVWCETKAGSGFFDDFRLHPVDASMISYVYNEWGELSHILDNNNLYTEFKYDALGRLTSTSRETFQQGTNGKVKLSEVAYNYGRNHEASFGITANSYGPNGTISNMGTTQVPLGGSLTIDFIKNCPNRNPSLTIDNVSYTTASQSLTLNDETKVTINAGGIRLDNVRSPHTISVTYTTYPAGAVYCYFSEEWSNCTDNQYQYVNYDACGNAGTYYIANSWNAVPANIRAGYTQFNCLCADRP